MTIYPHSGTCAYCERERDDLFWHAQDETYYCADVFRCEARVQITVQRRYQKECLGLHTRGSAAAQEDVA